MLKMPLGFEPGHFSLIIVKKHHDTAGLSFFSPVYIITSVDRNYFGGPPKFSSFYTSCVAMKGDVWLAQVMMLKGKP